MNTKTDAELPKWWQLQPDSYEVVVTELLELRAKLQQHDLHDCATENEWELLELRKQNAKLVAAGNRLTACYETCICEDRTEPDCLGWKMLWVALAADRDETTHTAFELGEQG